MVEINYIFGVFNNLQGVPGNGGKNVFGILKWRIFGGSYHGNHNFASKRGLTSRRFEVKCMFTRSKISVIIILKK